MAYYGDNSDLKRAGRNIVTAEIIFPILVIIANATFLTIRLIALEYPVPDLLNLEEEDHLVALSCVLLIYALIDLILAWFLCIGVSKLSPSTCISWIICQTTLLIALISIVFLFPYFTISLAYVFWELICCALLLGVYKVYRLYVVHFLALEIRQEGFVWKGRAIYE